MNGYKAFYRGRSCEVWAETSRQAQVKAAVEFKARKEWEVHVVLCEKDGEPVTHSTSELG